MILPLSRTAGSMPHAELSLFSHGTHTVQITPRSMSLSVRGRPGLPRGQRRQETAPLGAKPGIYDMRLMRVSPGYLANSVTHPLQQEQANPRKPLLTNTLVRAPGRRPGDVIERGSELDRAGHRNR